LSGKSNPPPVTGVTPGTPPNPPQERAGAGTGVSVTPVPSVTPSNLSKKIKRKKWDAGCDAVGRDVTPFVERAPDEGAAVYLLRNAVQFGLTEDQRSRLSRAYRLNHQLYVGKAARAEAQRESYQLIKGVQQELGSAVVAAVDQAMRRGEKVETYNDAGAKRIKSRDGLRSLVESGALTETDERVGLAYRLLFEQAGKGAGLGSQLEDRPRSIRDSSHGAVAAGLFRAYAGVRLTGVETAVAAADRTGRALSMLRAVAGEGRTIASVGGGGNTRRTNLQALKVGLRVALAALHGNGGLRIGGS